MKPDVRVGQLPTDSYHSPVLVVALAVGPKELENAAAKVVTLEIVLHSCGSVGAGFVRYKLLSIRANSEPGIHPTLANAFFPSTITC